MKQYKIKGTVNCDEFMAESKEEALDLFWDSISDKYGVASSIDIDIEEDNI